MTFFFRFDTPSAECEMQIKHSASLPSLWRKPTTPSHITLPLLFKRRAPIAPNVSVASERNSNSESRLLSNSRCYFHNLLYYCWSCAVPCHYCPVLLPTTIPLCYWLVLLPCIIVLQYFLLLFSCTIPFNPLNPELNPICYLLALLEAHHFLHVSRIRVKLLTFRLLMSYIYGAPILDVSRSHTTTQHSR